MEIRRALPADLPLLVPMFDRYRQFYGQPSDPDRAWLYLTERFERGESVVFVALEAGHALGFVQLYPTFSSVSTARSLLLNDLYVEADARRGGVGRGLVAAAVAHGHAMGAARLSLQTGVANHTAQRLYESLGWRRQTDFLDYGLSLSP